MKGQLALAGVAPARPKTSLFEDPHTWPALVWQQPYAGLMRLAAAGLDAKSIETRDKVLHYRGPAVVIAGLQVDEEALARFDAAWLHERGIPMGEYMAAIEYRGVAVAVVDFADCRPLTRADEHRACFYRDGRHAWMARRIRSLDTFKARGWPGWSRVPLEQVRAALAADRRESFFCPSCGKRDAARLHLGPERHRCADDDAGPGCGQEWRACDCRSVRSVSSTEPHAVIDAWCERMPRADCDCGCAACPYEAP